jgi:hypothetical protein
MRVADERKQHTVKENEGGGSARRFVLGEVLPAVSVRQLESRARLVSCWRDLLVSCWREKTIFANF